MFPRLVVVAAFLLAAPALAQQPDPTTLQRAIAVLQQQRNTAMDQAAGASAENMRLTEENDRLKKQVEELKAAAPK